MGIKKMKMEAYVITHRRGVNEKATLLCGFFICSASRIRTCDQSITLIHTLLYGVDYIITGCIATLTAQGASNACGILLP
jgi:hypothetical protein